MNNLLLKKTTFFFIFLLAFLSIAIAQPSNDEPCNAITLTQSQTCSYATYSNVSATASTSVADPGCADYYGNDVWFQVVVPANGALSILTQSIGFTDGGMAIYSGTCGSLSQLECSDGDSNGSMPAITATYLTPSSTIWIRVWDFGGSSAGSFGICVAEPAPPQGCDQANPFCTGSIYTFPAATGVPDAGTLSCLYSTPNPAWYYLNIATSGNIVLDISMKDSSGFGRDVDFICYGPYTSLATACSNQIGDCSLSTYNPLSNNNACDGNVVDCSYSTSATEICGIQNAVAGQWYMLLLTNFANVPADITFSQGNTGAPGAGSTNCNILCSMSGLTATPGVCNPTTGNYTVTGTISYTDPPTSGTLTVSNTCNSITQVFNAPFAATSTNYSLAGLSATGASCTVTATFSGDPTCTFDTKFTSPNPCNTTCAITAVTATPSACNPQTNNYSVAGNITYSNPPTSGTLTIANSCGGTPVVVNAPFTSPSAYSFTGLTSNGATCNITAVFSASTTCTYTQAFTAPAACVLCPVVAGNSGPACINQTINLSATTITGASYSWTGPNGFTSTLQNPTITNLTSAKAGNYTVAIAITSPSACNSSSSTSVVMSPNPTVTVNSPTTCGSPAILTASGATSYSWSTTAATSSITVPATAATYTVVGTTNGCTGSAVSTVTTSAPPLVNFAADTLQGCNPLPVIFTANTTGNTGATYTWNYGDNTTGTGSNPSHTYTSSGCKTVILTVSLSASCAVSDTIPCMIDVYSKPDVDFVISPSEVDILNPIANFYNNSTNSTAWLWDFGEASSTSTLENPTHTYSSTGNFPVKLFATNAAGCADSITYYILVNDIITLFVPNTFSPNGDDVNDVFYVYSYGMDPDYYEFSIFDRWGNRIFKTKDLAEGWNGAVNNQGEIVERDVYVYHLNYKGLGKINKKKTLIGPVTLVR